MPFVQATVVRAQEPSSARPGDRAIILADGTIEGFVGGHCAAGSVRTAALGALDSGESLLLRVLPDGDDVFPEAPGASIVVNPCLSGGAMEIYLEPLLPSPVLHLVGTSPTAEAVADLAPALGFVVERAAEGADPAGATVAIVATHGDEAGAVRAALDAGVGFVGVVCSHTRASVPARRARPVTRGGGPRAHPRRASTSARGPRPSWRCRSWPPSSAASGSRDSPPSRPARRRRPGRRRPSTRSAG